jgi:hypothetical protein
MGNIMKTIVGLAFCVLLGVSIRGQGWTALLWVPAGFVFGLYATAQIVLPIILGLPRAIALVVKGQMRSAVFGAMILAPVIWLVSLAAAGFFWPAAADYLYNNVAFTLSANLGMIAIILSPLSKTSRSDFRQDFDKAYRRFYRGNVRTEMEEEERSKLSKLNPKQQKQVESAGRVASNLYLHTIPGAEDAPVTLHFSLPDSRFRYLIFCLSAVLRACAPTMDKDQFAVVFDEVLSLFVTWATTENAQEFFGGPVNPQDARRNGTTYLQAFLNDWSKYIALEKAGRDMEGVDLICSMIHTTESNVPAGTTDEQRLGKLALQIACQFPAMQGAFIELANR